MRGKHKVLSYEGKRQWGQEDEEEYGGLFPPRDVEKQGIPLGTKSIQVQTRGTKWRKMDQGSRQVDELSIKVYVSRKSCLDRILFTGHLQLIGCRSHQKDLVCKRNRDETNFRKFPRVNGYPL